MKLYYLNATLLSGDAFSVLLSGAEPYRAERVLKGISPEMKKETVGTDALIKYALSNESKVPPQSVRSAYKNGGAIYVVDSDVNISVAHSCGRVFVGVSDKKIGVDAELLRDIDWKKLSDRYFNEKEKERIALSDDKKKEFLLLWTEKEACFKYASEKYQSFLDVDTAFLPAHVHLEHDNCIVCAAGEETYELFEITENDLVSLIPPKE